MGVASAARPARSARSAAIVGSRGGYWRFFDVQLFVYMLLLIVCGLVVGFSVAFNRADPGYAGLTQPVRTLIWAGIGMTLYFVMAGLDYRWLQTLTVPIYLAVIGLLVLTALFGRDLFGAQMSVSIAGLDFQFSEISKVLMIAVLSSFLAGRGPRVGRLSTILGAAALVALPALLVFRQPDLGSAMVFVAILVGMLFMAGASLGWMALLAGAVVAVVPLAVGLLHDYQRARLLCFLDPMADPQGACYQLLSRCRRSGRVASSDRA